MKSPARSTKAKYVCLSVLFVKDQQTKEQSPLLLLDVVRTNGTIPLNSDAVSSQLEVNSLVLVK